MRTKALLLIVMLLGWAAGSWAADRVKGDGKLTTKKIEIEDFNEIKVDGVIDFNYVQSNATPTIEVTVDSNLHPYVNMEVKDRTLSVSFKGAKVDHFTKFIVTTNSKWLASAKVTGNANLMINSVLNGDETTIRANSNSLVQFKQPVKVGKLALKVAGSANMVVNDVTADKVELDIDGDGSITVKKGTANEGDYSIVTKGDIHAYGLEVSKINCKVTGNGLAEITPKQHLKAQIVGKGNIRYQGPTAVDQRVIGKGKVEEVVK